MINMPTLTKARIELYRKDIVRFAQEQFYIPETGKPIKLLPHQKKILRLAFTPKRGRMPYSTVVYSAPKKSGKTTVGALVGLWWALSQEPYNEIYCVANDQEQARSRVFQGITRAIELNPALAADTTRNALRFPATDTRIEALASEYAGAAGSNPGLTLFDELWAYYLERSQRLYEELTPSPTRKTSCRLIVTYAGYEGESLLLKNLYDRGLAGEQLDPELPVYANGSLFVYWDHEPRMPWQTEEYYESQRQELRPSAFARMHRNEWVTSEASFIEPEQWDACVDPDHRPLVADSGQPVYVGVDAATKRDTCAVVGVQYDRATGRVVLAFHKIWEPAPGSPLDLEETLEAYLLDMRERFNIAEVKYDPYAMQRSAPTLQKAGLRMVEYPQTVGNLTAMGDNLYNLVKGRNLMAYPAPDIRLAVLRAIAVETPRGWKITKEKQRHKIDVVVALAIAALAAVREGGQPRPQPFCSVSKKKGSGSGSWYYNTVSR